MFSKIKYENKLVKETNRKLGKFVSFSNKGEEQGILDIFLLEPKKESAERYRFRSSFYEGKISEDISKWWGSKTVREAIEFFHESALLKNKKFENFREITEIEAVLKNNLKIDLSTF